MIIELICTPLFALIYGIIALLPNVFTLPGWALQAVNLIAKAMIVFPADVWIIVIGNIGFWMQVQMGWAIIEWIYKKIPGVD